jgi:hypothetical protein
MKLSRILRESGPRLTPSMRQFIDLAAPELWKNWDHFYANATPTPRSRWHPQERTNPSQGSAANVFPTNPAWHYPGPRKAFEGDPGALVLCPDGSELTVFVQMSTLGSSAQLVWPHPDGEAGDGFEPYGTIYLNKDQATSYPHFREILAHELAHLVDKKERDGHPAHAHRRRQEKLYNSGQLRYDQQDHEVDASLVALADRRLQGMRHLSHDQLLQKLRTLQPQFELERNLVQYGQWQRYLQTIYRMAQTMGQP